MQTMRHLRGPPSTSLPGPGLGAWPGERRASSPEQPGCSPVGERLGQSQFLYWALDGTDGRKFKGSQPAICGVSDKGVCQLSKGGGCHGGCAASSSIPQVYPLYGVPPLPLPCCIPLASHPILSSQRVVCAAPKLDGPARAVARNHAPASWT